MKMLNCMNEILRIGNKSLVEIYDVSDFRAKETKKFVVCRDFKEGKPYGTAWSHAIAYIDMWNYTSREFALQDALDCFMDIKKQPIEYDRLLDIAKESLKAHFDAEPDEAKTYCEETLELTDDEWRILDLPEQQKFDIIEVTFTREMKCTRTLVVPHGTDEYELDNYFDANDLQDADFETDWSTNTEISELCGIKEELTYDEACDEDFDNDIDTIA